MYNFRRKQERFSLFMNKILSVLSIVVLLSFTAGCSSNTVKYINPTADFSYIKKVAIVPFNNLTPDSYASEKLRSILTVEILSRKYFDLVEQGQTRRVVTQILRAQGIPEGSAASYDTETIKLIGEELGVQAIIIGGVNEYPSRDSSVASLSLKMIDTSSGVVLWQVITAVKGSNAFKSFFGMEDSSPIDLAFRVVKRALNTL